MLELWRDIRKNLNFFRVHLLFFTFTPLVASTIFYASNGRYPVSYIDALFNCVSAMTVCGLTTVNLSGLTPWQQVILFLQMCIGSPVLVSWFIVYNQRNSFAKKFRHLIKAEAERRASTRAAEATSSGREHSLPRRVSALFRRRPGLSPLPEDESNGSGDHLASKEKEKEGDRKLRTDMIRRTDTPPRLVDPNGQIIDEDLPVEERKGRKELSPVIEISPEQVPVTGDQKSRQEHNVGQSNCEPVVKGNHDKGPPTPSSPTVNAPLSHVPLAKSSMLHSSPEADGQPGQMPRTSTIEFSPVVVLQDTAQSTNSDPDVHQDYHGVTRRRRSTVLSGSHPPIAQHPTIYTYRSTREPQPAGYSEPEQSQQKYSGLGGFPMPHQILGRLLGWLFPRAKKRLRRTMTIPATTTITGSAYARTYSNSAPSHRGGRSFAGRLNAVDLDPAHATKPVPYISFDAIVGRNSAFHSLTNEQLEELGGVEYRALNVLLWLLTVYHCGIQIIAFVIFAPYMSMSRWSGDFVPPALLRTVSPPWYSFFQVVSAYTNTGMSLVDQSMIPFQTAYPVIVILIICILAGYTAFPICLRFSIWVFTKFVPADSRLHETLHFLLDHPRRCFIYLFPSHQTWFLLTVLLVLNVTDWVCFIILDIGNPAISSIPLGTRVLAGLYQGISVRNAGFGIVPLALLTPAIQVLYVVMMYISVYPLALSVRSTNVYEERSLGIYRDKARDEEAAFQPTGSRMTVWSRYLAMHARNQLFFDMWWLALALFLLCIIERDNLDNPNIQGWFNIFAIIFEIVSAYGSVGLSLGIPDQNYSFSGALRPLSKLVICLVMIRGRHRGLPVAIDRAIMLPFEFKVERSPDAQVENPPSEDEMRSRPPLPNGLGEVHHAQGNKSEDEGEKRDSNEIKSNVER
ncbi:cation transport protein-domain-containing protein [Scleroderma yunnanense]